MRRWLLMTVYAAILATGTLVLAQRPGPPPPPPPQPPPPGFSDGITLGKAFLINYFPGNWTTATIGISATAMAPWADWQPGTGFRDLPVTPLAVPESGLMMYICRQGPCVPMDPNTHRFVDLVNRVSASVSDVQVNATTHKRTWRLNFKDGIQATRTDAFPPGGGAFEAFYPVKTFFPTAPGFCLPAPAPQPQGGKLPLFCPGDVVVVHLADTTVIPEGYPGAGLTQVERMLAGTGATDFGPPLAHRVFAPCYAQKILLDVNGNPVYRAVICDYVP